MMSTKFPLAETARLHDKETKLLHISKSGFFSTNQLSDLPSLLQKGDVLVVNDSGVIPASFDALVQSTNQKVEFRLVQISDPTFQSYQKWDCIIYEEGSWKQKTEDRRIINNLKQGDVLNITENIYAIITEKQSDKIYSISFNCNCSDIFYKYGKLIQYSYLTHELELWDGQTIFSSRPVSVEPPSASFQLTWNLMLSLINKGVKVVPITHAISLSSTGDPNLDQLLPFPEKYQISYKTASVLNGALWNNDRIIALGTSVMRALESNISNGLIKEGNFESNLKITKKYKLKIVDGLITGMHIPNAPHFELLQSLISKEEIGIAYEDARGLGYKWHEYGDLTLIL